MGLARDPVALVGSVRFCVGSVLTGPGEVLWGPVRSCEGTEALGSEILSIVNGI